MTTSPDFLNPNHATIRTSLGLSLGKREVGLAIASREHLVQDRVINLRKIPSPDGRERRFQQVISKCLDDYPVGRIAAVLPPGRHAQDPHVQAQRVWLEQEAARRGLRVRFHEPDAIKVGLVSTEKQRQTLRGMAESLAEQFPELKSKAPSATPNPGSEHLPEFAERPRRTRPARERYWARMFLALGAAMHDLNQDVLNDLPL